VGDPYWNLIITFEKPVRCCLSQP